jgi:phosphate acyltransferase
MIWIAVDAMGGDYAPRHVVDGALAAARHFDLGVALVGQRALVEAELLRHPDADRDRARVVEAADVIAMDESPAAALRRQPGASIRIAADLVARGEAAALFSAGHTGATVMAGHGAFGMLPGVDRPALAATLPTRGKQPAILLDVGASVECRSRHLLQFAVMGTVYARIAFGIETPRVGLLSIGEEETKGNELTRDAHRLLKDAPLAFVGNVEARSVFAGDADVIVCDGFTGNVALKISEGLVEVVEALLSDELSTTMTERVEPSLTRRVLRHLRGRLDYSEYGGAPLLGVAGVAIVGHGRSSPKAVRNAVAMAYRFASEHFIQRVEHEIAAAAGPAADPGTRRRGERRAAGTGRRADERRASAPGDGTCAGGRRAARSVSE